MALLQEPCLTWVLRDVVCDACSACRDLDLARDPALQVHWEALGWNGGGWGLCRG